MYRGRLCTQLKESAYSSLSWVRDVNWLSDMFRSERVLRPLHDELQLAAQCDTYKLFRLVSVANSDGGSEATPPICRPMKLQSS